MEAYELYPLGDAALVVNFGDVIGEQIQRRVQVLTRCLQERSLPWLIELVPAFTSVTVYYDPLLVMQSVRRCGQGASGDVSSIYESVCDMVEQVVRQMPDAGSFQAREVEIPVCYGGEYGPDLAEVAERNGLSADEVVRIHCSGEYRVYLIGFAPGFPYLGGMSERIAAPRRSSPRLKIPAGSVGIAGRQTGVYPIETPGGWQLIGRTPIPLFLPDADPPSLLQAGDVVRFKSITAEEYAAWTAQQK